MTSRNGRFKKLVEQTPGLSGAYRPGLQALRGRDRARITSIQPRRLRGSIDLDEALKRAEQNADRWDYIIGVDVIGTGEVAAYAEVHRASACEVRKMLRKVRWLRAWLAGSGAAMRSLPLHGGVLYWVATDGVGIPKTSPQHRMIAAAGLVIRRHLQLP